MIGAGPAGTMAALLGAIENLDVLLVEKKRIGIYRPCSGNYPLHNVKGFPSIPDAVFERDLVTSRFMSPRNYGLLDAREFNTTLGKVVLRSKYDLYMLDLIRKRGVDVRDSTEVTRVRYKDDGVVVTMKDGSSVEEDVSADVLFIATGVSGFRLHGQLGLETPPLVNSMIAEFESSEDHVENVLSSGAYHYYLNKKISSIGPLWITCRGDGSFNSGLIDYNIDKNKFFRALEKDPNLRNLFKGVKERPIENTGKHYTFAQVPLKPVSKPYADRVLLLGDAAGLAQQFYFEGMWEGRLSAKLAVNLIAKLRDSGKPFNEKNLSEYKKSLAVTLVNGFLRSGRRNSYMFWKSRNDEEIWYYFCEAIRSSKKFRELIVSCYEYDYHNTEPDIKAGEMILKTMPIFKKINLLSYFMKAASVK
ncbi:MAG: NAD(P)/FAD-dependent oxidoreductase [Promethearchaeota archaeon]